MDINVPLKALQIQDGADNAAPATPAQGDEVSFTVKGKVNRIDGTDAVVSPETINDQPVSGGQNQGQSLDDMENEVNAGLSAKPAASQGY